MQLLHNRKLALAFSFIGLALTSLGIQSNQINSDPMITQEEQEALELHARYQQVLEQTFRLKNTLIQVASTISNIRAEAISDKKAALSFIKNWQLAIDTSIDDIEKTEDIQYLPGKLVTLINLCLTCAQELSIALQNNFINAQFTYEFIPSRSIVLSFDELDAHLKLFEKSFNDLTQQAQCIGLTFKNKVVRKIDDALAWCSRNHIGKMLFFGGSLSAIGIYWFWHEMCPQSDHYAIKDGSYATPLDNREQIIIPGSAVINGYKESNGSFINYTDTETPIWQGLIQEKGNSWTNYLTTKITGFLGMPASHNIKGKFGFAFPEDKGWINSFDAAVNNAIGQRFTPLLQLSGGILLTKASELVYNSIMPSFKKVFSSKWNELRGGAYAEQPVAGVFEFTPHSTFDDIIGMDDYKERFKVLLNYCAYPERFTQDGSKPVTGYAFTGPTRTGKTFLANALCGQIDKFLSLKGIPTQFRYLKVPGNAVASHGLSTVMELARSMAPCVIFIDEFDLCGAQRGTNQSFVLDALTELGDPTKNDPLKPIITIIATNRAHNIDTALFTPGRLGEEVRFDYPCIEDRIRFIEHTLHKAGINTDKFDIIRLAQKVNGKSFEDMARFIINARSKAYIYNTAITQDLLEHSINEEIRRVIFFDRKHLPKRETQILSAHFAGQALATMLLQGGDVLDMVTINAFIPKIIEEQNTGTGRESFQPKVLAGKLFMRPVLDTVGPDDFGLCDGQQIINIIKCLVAGVVAEEIVLGCISSNLCDQQSSIDAYELAKQATFGGLWKGQLADALYNKLSEEAHNLFIQCKQEVKTLLEEHREQLDALVLALTLQKMLSDEEVKVIMQNPALIYEIEKELKAQAQQA